ncbi:MAG: hypothetical protein WB565_00795 [Acidimicrobiales bacterium]
MMGTSERRRLLRIDGRKWPKGGGRRTSAALLVASVGVGGLLAACSSSSSGSPTTQAGGGSGTVLLVGTFHGHRGQYSTIQSAVDAAKPGDWILVAPGDYHETDDLTGGAVDPAHGESAGVLIKTPDLHLRGMQRSQVVVDGTKAGAPGSCSAYAVDQNLGPLGKGGQAEGRNGIVVWKANDVSIDNLTVCNFLAGAGASGNEIWWNGGDDSGKIGMHGYSGDYLSATSTYFGTSSNTKANETTAAQYGIFASNTAGPGSWNQLYASNFNDSGMYVGACQQVCGVNIDHAWMEYSALGYSGTNSGGAIVIENSQFDNNKDGFDTNTQINGDPPAPQNGACPSNGISPITHTHSCWVFIHNYSHDNNNPNVPEAGNAGNGPTGTGMTLSGGRNDTVMDNTFSNNGGWGFLMVPYPDSNPPEDNQSCSGTGGVESAGLGCVYDPMNDALLHNTFNHNGFFGNDGNADYGLLTFSSGQPGNCFAGNSAPNGSSPPNLEATYPTCGKTTTTALSSGPLLNQVLCDTGFGACSASTVYPQETGVVMHPLPSGIPTMPDPCTGVPDNAWCANGRPIGNASS